MNIKVKSGVIESESTEAIVVGVFEKAELPEGAAQIVDDATGNTIRDIISSGDCTGTLNQTILLYPRGEIAAKRLLVVGLGEKGKFDLERLRQVASKAGRQLRDLGVKSYVIPIHDMNVNLDLNDTIQAIVEGSLLGLYQFNEHKTVARGEIKTVDEITLLVPDEALVSPVATAVEMGEIISEGAILARELSNQPSNIATPAMLAEGALRIAEETGLKCEILDRDKLEEMGCGAFLAVARGSQEPPKFIILEHNSDAKDVDTVVIIGKGITFDSGGISIKPSDKMAQMKHDMSGGAAVLGAMQTVARLKLPGRVVGLVPATENMPSGTAQKPGDVIKSLSAQTIEVINTDAEGRLILADALAFAQRYNPAGVIDLATLTGACVIALGHHATGMLGTDNALMAKVNAAAEKTGERVWQLPLWDEYDDAIKSDVADVKNVSSDRSAGTIIGAAFLKKFAAEYPWVHLDIAGTAYRDKELPYSAKGATGVGVRLLVQLLRDW